MDSANAFAKGSAQVSNQASAVAAPAPVGNPQRSADLLAIALFVLAIVLAYGARNELNPDGISYLDLSAALRAGSFSSFVQGYWSPLYPALVALLSVITGHTFAALVRDVHALNAVVAAVAIGAVWWTVRKSSNIAFVRMSFGVLLLCSWRPPRVDAVTPDLLLLTLMIVITWELVLNEGRRWWLLGALLGLSFLAKTSAWPWLLVTMCVRLWFAKRTGSIRPVLLSSAVCLGVMLLWIVPLSIEARKFTLGDSGALNECWYLETCDSRTPDTHRGQHLQYQTTTLNGNLPVIWAQFEQQATDQRTVAPTTAASDFHFTYLPWSDPSAWAKGVVSYSAIPFTAKGLAGYWLTLAFYVFGYWLLAMFLAVLAPAAILFWRKDSLQRLRTSDSNALLVMLLGLLGMLQFVAVHAEPRLVAPFALMFALAMLVWLCEPKTTATTGGQDSSVRAREKFGKWFTFLSLAGILTSIPFSARSIRDSYGKEQLAQQRVDAISKALAAQGRSDVGTQRVVVVGSAIPVLADAYRLGDYIVAQILPSSAAALEALPVPQRRMLVEQLFRGKADVAWFSSPKGDFSMVPLNRFRQ